MTRFFDSLYGPTVFAFSPIPRRSDFSTVAIGVNKAVGLCEGTAALDCEAV